MFVPQSKRRVGGYLSFDYAAQIACGSAQDELL